MLNEKLLQLADEYIKAGYFKKKDTVFHGIRMSKEQADVMRKVEALVK